MIATMIFQNGTSITVGSTCTRMRCLVTDFEVSALTGGVSTWVLSAHLDEVCTFRHLT